MSKKVSILVEWYDANHKIIIGEVANSWTWDDLQLARNSLNDLATSVAHQVSLVVILPQDLSVPPSGFAENSEVALKNHAALGLHTVIYVTKNAGTKALWQSVIDVYASPSVNYHIVPTLDIAIASLP